MPNKVLTITLYGVSHDSNTPQNDGIKFTVKAHKNSCSSKFVHKNTLSVSFEMNLELNLEFNYELFTVRYSDRPPVILASH